jgi:kinesin family protein C1
MQQMVNVLAPSMQKLVDANQRLAGQYNKEREIRKKLQNDLIELRGNIRVFCRVRPSASGDACTEFTGEQELIIRNAAAAAAAANKAAAVSLFQFDRVFNMQSTQAQVFAEVAPFVQSCIDGYNVCIFACTLSYVFT